MTAFPLLLALMVAVPVGAAPGHVAERLDAGLAGRPAGPARAAWASGILRGAPYSRSPLGESAPPDRGPRFRLDAFDCTTLVETAIALGNAASVAEARRLLDDVRYDGPPDLAHRNHFVEAQWLPANARKGWIEDLTRALGGEAVDVAVVHHSAAGWVEAARRGRLPAGLAPAWLPAGDFELPVLPLDRLVEAGPRIPEGTVLLLVRAERTGRPTRVTHMGLVVAGPRGEGSTAPGGARVVRHASPGSRRVLDERLSSFARRMAAQPGPPVVGVSLWAIRDNQARARRLLAEQPGIEGPPPAIAAPPPRPPSASEAPPEMPGPPAAPRPVTGSPAPAPREAASLRSPLTDVARVVPDAVLDLRYASSRNLAGRPLYGAPRCLLLAPVAERLARAAAELGGHGYRLVLWDCYRPLAVQRELWRLRPDRRWVADPARGSNHNRAAAVDVSLAAPDGRPVEMPTDHDAFDARARPEAVQGLAPPVLERRALLRRAMEAAGFRQNRGEWWHYDAPEARGAPLLDVPIAAATP